MTFRQHFFISILSGVKEQLLSNLRNSFGYSKSASKTQPFELLFCIYFKILLKFCL